MLVLSLGYGMWLYSESLRTGKAFEVLLKRDFMAKRESIYELMAKDKDWFIKLAGIV